MKEVDVLVVGAGMGGLALGLALHRAGVPARIFEQAPELSEVGAGIMMTPNACRAIDGLDVFDAIDARALRPAATHYRDYRTSEIISSVVYDEAFQRRYNGPYLTIHRGDLQDALKQALVSRAPDMLKLDHLLVDVEQRGDRVTAIFANGERIDGDVLIAADGVRSIIREKVFGIKAADFSGHVAFRGMAPIDGLPDRFRTTDTSTCLGPGQHFVMYTVKKGAFVNFVAIPERGGWTEEGWSVPATPQELKQEFADWHPMFHSLIEATPPDRLFKWGLFDREPLPRWVDRRVALLGDAAHPTTPFMAQGAAMSFEDAVVLGRALVEAATIDEALGRYERARKQRGGWVQVRSRFFGELYHRQAPADEVNRERRAANDVLYPYDATTVTLE
ncbi:MAG: FAD-dependent monooxygenase [Dehalococcoidia bacterium]